MSAERQAIGWPVAGEKSAISENEHSSLADDSPADVPLAHRFHLSSFSDLRRGVGGGIYVNLRGLRARWVGWTGSVNSWCRDGSFVRVGGAILAGMSRGYFITFEGGEGTGKSTQLGLLNDWLTTLGHTTVVTREPGGTRLAEAVRALLLDPELEPDGLSEIFLLEASRHDHVERVIRPAIEDGAVVLCDRFTDSSLVYQGLVRGLGWDEVAKLNRLATGNLEPDLTLVFDMDPEAALTRARSRNSEGSLCESRLDDEPAEFHRRVREGFLDLAERDPDRVRVIDAEGPPEKVFARIHSVLPEALR